MTEPFHHSPADSQHIEPQPVKFVSFPVADRSLMRDSLMETTNDPETVEHVIGTLATQDQASRQKDVDNYKQLIHTEDRLVVSEIDREEKVRELERLERENRFDTLTGLFNRRYFESRVNKLIQSGKRFSVVLLDLDGFKLLNDSRGHNAGDDILRAVGGVLKEQEIVKLRDGDFAARLGGDEFAILLNTEFEGNGLRHDKNDKESRDGAIRRLDNDIHSAAEAKYVGANISISAGAADHHEGESYEELMHRVDELMYDSKTSKKAYRELVQARDDNKLPTSAYAELKSLPKVTYRGEEWGVYDTKNLQSKIERFFADADAVKQGRHDDAYRDPLSLEVSRFTHVFERFGRDHSAIWKRLERLAMQKRALINATRDESSAIPIAHRQSDLMEWMLNTEAERKVLMTAAYGFMRRIVLQNQVAHLEEKLNAIDLVK